MFPPFFSALPAYLFKRASSSVQPHPFICQIFLLRKFRHISTADASHLSFFLNEKAGVFRCFDVCWLYFSCGGTPGRPGRSLWVEDEVIPRAPGFPKPSQRQKLYYFPFLGISRRMQIKLLDKAMMVCKTGGRIVYSTCGQGPTATPPTFLFPLVFLLFYFHSPFLMHLIPATSE